MSGATLTDQRSTGRNASVLDDPEAQARFAELFRANKSSREIGAEFGLCMESARRWALKLGLRPKGARQARATFTRQQKEDAAEGIPATWNAERSGYGVELFRRMHRELPNRAENNREWFQVWGELRHRPDLMALHLQFAPRRADRATRG